MDKERLIRGHLFTDEYFERQLQQIREIRLSERMFYQKVTDLYATAFQHNEKPDRFFCQAYVLPRFLRGLPRILP